MAELNDHIFELGDENVIQHTIYEMAMKDCAALNLHFKDRPLDANYDYEAAIHHHQPSLNPAGPPPPPPFIGNYCATGRHPGGDQ